MEVSDEESSEDEFQEVVAGQAIMKIRKNKVIINSYFDEQFK